MCPPEEEIEVQTIPRKWIIDPGVLVAKDFIRAIGNNYNAALPQSEDKGDGFQAGLILHFSYFSKLILRTGLLYHRFNFEQIGPYSFGTYYYQNTVEALEVAVNLRYRTLNGDRKFSP